MTNDYAKSEFKKRYKYLYENALFILVPNLKELDKNESERLRRNENINGCDDLLFCDPDIYLKKLDSSLLFLIEELLLSDSPMETSRLFNLVESKKSDSEYLNEFKKGIGLLEKGNANRSMILEQVKLDLWRLLTEVRNNISGQSEDLRNRELKLIALDEYFRVARYRNDGTVWISGFRFCLADIKNVIGNARIPSISNTSSRNKNNVGVKNNDFINLFAHGDNPLRLTEKEKQEIYLELHDELPWNLDIKCNLNSGFENDENSLIKLGLTFPCGESFYIKESYIFVNPNDNSKYYQLCSNCGYIVDIPEELLSDGLKKRIQERCSKDKDFFNANVTYSKLCFLDKGRKVLSRNIPPNKKFKKTN